MVIHFLQVAVDPPILPNLNATHKDLFKGNVDVKELRFDLRLNLPGKRCSMSYLLQRADIAAFRDSKERENSRGVALWYAELLRPVRLQAIWDLDLRS